MIVRRLASFFTLLAFVFFSATWLLRRSFGFPAADITAMFSQGVVIIGAYFVIGMFLARMGIALVNEVLESKHQIEEDKRERARNLYLTAISGTKSASMSSGLSIDLSETSDDKPGDSTPKTGKGPGKGGKAEDVDI